MSALDLILGSDRADAHRRLQRLMGLFIVGNLAFLAVDVYLAHLENHFRHPAEWIPVGFSALAPLCMLPALIRPQGRGPRRLWILMAALSICVGVAGLVLHLSNTFFVRHTLADLVYTAPFVAPLAYAGLGLLALLNVTDQPPQDWARWVALLAAGGFLGNLGLSLADHAINGFFHATEWIPVGASSFAFSALLMMALAPTDRALRGLTVGLMGVQIVVGLAGLALHIMAPAHGWGTDHQSVVTGAPIFAPMLFADLAVLGLISALGLSSAARSAR